jgi:hypothetical protein
MNVLGEWNKSKKTTLTVRAEGEKSLKRLSNSRVGVNPSTNSLLFTRRNTTAWEGGRYSPGAPPPARL